MNLRHCYSEGLFESSDSLTSREIDDDFSCGEFKSPERLIDMWCIFIISCRV